MFFYVLLFAECCFMELEKFSREANLTMQAVSVLMLLRELWFIIFTYASMALP